jgi:hypothetical protein
MWGPKGLIITHAGFELGVATLIAPLGLRQARFSFDDVASFQQYGLTKWYRDHAKDVAKLGLYDKFYDSGWTTELARIIRRQLAPMLVKAVSVTWYAAIEEANRAKPHVVL